MKSKKSKIEQEVEACICIVESYCSSVEKIILLIARMH